MNDPDVLMRSFGWVNYLMFGLVLVVSSMIGVYHAWKGASNSTSEYLMGGKKMGIFPIAMSLAAGTLSATALLATPTDVYLTGTMHWWMVVAVMLAVPASTYLYLPVLHKLQVVSANQYLELRFNHIIRRFASLLYIFRQLFYSAIVLYGPSLALKQMVGIDVYITVSVTFVVCVFYTSIGGIRAVVWTDTLQIILMCGSIITILVKGVIDVGGVDVVWQRSLNSSRIEFFNIDPDPTTRQTIWSTVIGGFFFWTAIHAVDQIAVQRFLVMPTLRKANISMGANAILIGVIITLCCFIGMVAYARFFDCDPLTAKMIEKPDQIIPFFVMDAVGTLPGLPGLFVAGVFSGALSSLSSGLNSMALVVLEDFIRPFWSNLDDKKATRITKGVSVGVGFICLGLVFLVSHVKTILDASLSFSGSVAGTVLGVFTLGMFVPWANSIGAGVGMAISFVLMMWLGIASQIAKSRGFVHNQMKPFSIENCPIRNETATFEADVTTEPEDIFVLLKVSYLWYTLMGMLIVLIVGTAISFLTGPQDPEVLDNRLVSSVIRRRVGQRRVRGGSQEKEMISM